MDGSRPGSNGGGPLSPSACTIVLFTSRAGIAYPTLVTALLAARGIHGIARRLPLLKQRSFDAKYQSGEWVYEEHDEPTTEAVRRFAAGGRVLMLGCGTASMLEHLPSDSYSEVVGVDLSATAIR